jgi:hypothetical protein
MQNVQETDFYCFACSTRDPAAREGSTHPDTYCAPCSIICDTWHEANTQLKASLEPVIKAWREHWTAAGIDAGIVSDITNDVLEVLAYANREH